MLREIRVKSASAVAIVAAAWLVSACASAPETRPERQRLEAQADMTVDEMVQQDPSLQPVLDTAVGYVVFPSIGSGGLLVGAAQGVGVVYENGRPIGYASLNEVNVGALAGGRSFSELIVFNDRAAFERLLAGDFDLTANASATAVRSGAGAQANFQGGTAVFVYGESGLMAEASVGGQQIDFEPMA